MIMKYIKISDISDIYTIIDKINNNIDFENEYKLENIIDSLNHAIKQVRSKKSNKYTEMLHTTLKDITYLYWIKILCVLKVNIIPNHQDKLTQNLNTLIINFMDSIENLISEPDKYKIAISKIKNIKLEFDSNLLTDAALINRLAEKNKESRVKLGLKQKTLAEYIGISKYILCRIENAEYKIFPKEIALKISEYFGCESLDEFMDLVPMISAMFRLNPIFKFHYNLITNSKHTPFMKNLAKIYRMGPEVFDEYVKYSDAFFQKYITDNK